MSVLCAISAVICVLVCAISVCFNLCNLCNMVRTAKKYALVKWVAGPYTGTYTHNVDIDWISSFDPDGDDYGEDHESFVIEWRVPPKPARGWPVYDGIVLAVSIDLDYLKGEEKRRMDSEASKAPGEKSAFDLNSPIFKDAVSAAVAAAMANLNANPSTPRRPRPEARPNPSPDQPHVTSVATKKVLVGKALYVDEPVYNVVKHSSSPGSAIGALLRQAFSRRRLILSTYAGQKKTINNKVIQKPGLKKYIKMRDIEYFIKGKFGNMTQSSFCLTVNRYLGEAANSKPEVEYVETSGSEDEGDANMD